MDFEKENKKLTVWRDVVLFFIGVVILSFMPKMQKNEMPEPDGKEVWNYITTANNYENWSQWPGYDGMYEGQSPHGAFLKLYVNDVAKKAIQDGAKTMPDKALIVKENYNKKKELAAVTPMYKVENYNSNAGDWFWAKYGSDGEVMAEGKVGSCIDCHNKVSSNDYLFTAAN
ncbi:MAG: cytochrome P460 family protein [Prolixibacteraceae bacterium]